MAKAKSIKKRRKQAREEIIEDILQIAREMMQQDGVGALSFNAIARELGIKPPSLYTYFDSKNAIYDALFRRGFIDFGERMLKPEFTTLEAYIATMTRTYMAFAIGNPDLFQIMFQRPIPDFVPSDESMAISLQALADAQQQTRDLFAEHGIDPGIPIENAVDILIATVHGLASLHLANHPELPLGEGRLGQVIDQSAQILARAWQPDQ